MAANSMYERPGQTHIDAVRERFPNAVKSVSWVQERQPVITVDRDSAPDVVEYLYYGRGGWISVMVGNDERGLCGCYALYYVLSMEEDDCCLLQVRVEVDPCDLVFKSVSPKVPAVVWSEREVQDMFGLRAEGIIDNRNLVLPDDWPVGLYPLRKDTMDYRYRPEPTCDVENYEFLKDVEGSNTTVLSMGPMHVTSDEPGHFRLYVDGEDIVDADYRMFFVHRGMEKLAESRMTYDQVPFLAERVCGICGFAHSVAYAQTIERAHGVEVPLRAQYIRAVVLETERLHSHLLNLGLVCHYSGFDTGFQHFFRVREKSMDLAEMLTGARKTYGLNLIGGVRRDILARQKMEIFKCCRELRAEVGFLIEELLTTPNFEARSSGIGCLDPKICRDYSPVGPYVRGSGFARDTRWTHPYEAYRYIAANHKAVTQDTCDVRGRTLVRIGEFFDSLSIIEELLSTELPAGPVLNDRFDVVPNRLAMGWVEAPRGEDLHWSMIGDNQKCYRWRAKASTYSNWPSLRYALRGNTVSDAALIIGSLDPCYSCTERVAIVDVKKGKSQTVAMTQLEDYCRNRVHSPIEM